MWKKIILISLIILTYSFICMNIYNRYKPIKYKEKTIEEKITQNKYTPVITQPLIKVKEELPIGKLIIKKINLEENLYDITSNKNNIEKNVTILKESESPSIENTTFFLAAHSGTGPLAYFEELDKLEINDLIILEYQNKTYTYKVKNIWTDKKTGIITLPKENTNQLVLTTCHPTKDNYQLIINCIKI